MQSLTISEAVMHMQQGGIVAYPTEAVYGLGCDLQQEKTVHYLLEIKKRPIAAGLILIADTFERIQPYLGDVTPAQLQLMLDSWPGPVTWLVPKSARVPGWIAGQHNSVAVRVTAHPVAAALCTAWGAPIVSTSANVHGFTPARTVTELATLFEGAIAGVVTGELGGRENPSEIRDVVSGKIVR